LIYHKKISQFTQFPQSNLPSSLFSHLYDMTGISNRVGGNLWSAPGLMLIFREPAVSAVFNINHELSSEPP